MTKLHVWNDPVPRPGPDNMAIDEALLATVRRRPILRIYQWAGDWVSLGYFQNLAEARHLFPDPGLQFVRRMTGGGIVDHRNDLTYYLIVTRGTPLADARGDASYRIIHQAVAGAMQRSGVPARMLSEDDASDSAACFDHGVTWDLVGADGRKLAGAGQKRTRSGLLHQGSILVSGAVDWSSLSDALVDGLASDPQAWAPEPDLVFHARDLVLSRYSTSDWLERR